MVMKSLLGFALILAPVAAPAAPPAQPVAPRWVADWGDTKCSLSREAGPVALSLQFAPGTEAFELRAADLRWKKVPLRDGQEVGITLDGRPAGAVPALQLSGKGLKGFTGQGLTRDFLRQFAKSSTLRLQVDSRPILELSLTGAGKAVEALLACEADALRAWGVDPADRFPVKTLPRAHKHLTSLVTDDDYPLDALRKNAQGTSVVRLAVGTDGRVAECRLLSSSGSASIDQKTCAVFRERARFDPATGADGKPTRSYVVTQLTWRIASG
jgi:TonB family protein